MVKKKYDTFTNILTIFLKLIPKKFRVRLLYCFRKTLGKKGLVIRGSIVKTLAKECGENVYVFPDVYLFNIDRLSLGNNISIHPMSYIDASGGIDIEDEVSIAHGATILSTSHNFEDLNVPIRNQGLIFKKTVIKRNVWIGAKVTILCGVTIESGSIVAANTVVTKNVLKNNVVGGSPSRVLKVRI